ncbi:FlgD immunoglobulin-like domain containing protein, partial [Candidatus Latescibacterota bacterium]
MRLITFSVLLTITSGLYVIGEPWLETISLVTDEAAGNQGNSWGGHQCRIVRTVDGVFSVYMSGGENDVQKIWRLAWLDGDQWRVIAEDMGGNSPVHLLASPDGIINVIGWPETGTVMWSGKMNDGFITLEKKNISGLPKTSVIYYAAGISENGDICVTNSGGNESQGQFRWSFYQKDTDKWTFHYTRNDYRYCYSYIFPLPGGKLSIVSNRDEPWSRLGYESPDGAFGYVFNAIRYWHTDDIKDQPLEEYGYIVEEPTEEHLSVQCYMGYHNAYLDTKGRMHIVYHVAGPSTEGRRVLKHTVYSPEGTQLYNGDLPEVAGGYCDIFEDDRGQFYLLSSTGLLFPAGTDGISYGSPVELDFGDNNVEYAGLTLATPRSGTPLGDVIDGVYSTKSGTGVVYFRINLYGEKPSGIEEHTNLKTRSPVIFQNTPNPFNASTTIRYHVHETAHITILVYNSIGQLVKSLVDSMKQPGTYSVMWDGTDESSAPVNSGLYFYRLG